MSDRNVMAFIPRTIKEKIFRQFKECRKSPSMVSDYFGYDLETTIAIINSFLPDDEKIRNEAKNGKGASVSQSAHKHRSSSVSRSKGCLSEEEMEEYLKTYEKR